MSQSAVIRDGVEQKGWQCEKCTLKNKEHDQQCNACLAPRPYREGMRRYCTSFLLLLICCDVI